MITITANCQAPREYLEVSALVSFVYANPKYFQLICLIISNCYTISKFQMTSIKKLYASLSVEPSNELENLVNDLYSVSSDGELNNRRGAFLEGLTELVGPINEGSSFGRHRECRFMDDGSPVCHPTKTLDFVFEFSGMQWEAHECKTNIKGILRNRYSDSMEKLEYIKCLALYFDSKKHTFKAYIPTLSSHPIREEAILKSYYITLISRQRFAHLLMK